VEAPQGETSPQQAVDEKPIFTVTNKGVPLGRGEIFEVTTSRTGPPHSPQDSLEESSGNPQAPKDGDALKEGGYADITEKLGKLGKKTHAFYDLSTRFFININASIAAIDKQLEFHGTRLSLLELGKTSESPQPPEEWSQEQPEATPRTENISGSSRDRMLSNNELTKKLNALAVYVVALRDSHAERLDAVDTHIKTLFESLQGSQNAIIKLLSITKTVEDPATPTDMSAPPSLPLPEGMEWTPLPKNVKVVPCQVCGGNLTIYEANRITGTLKKNPCFSCYDTGLKVQLKK